MRPHFRASSSAMRSYSDATANKHLTKSLRTEARAASSSLSVGVSMDSTLLASVMNFTELVMAPVPVSESIRTEGAVWL